MMWAKQKLWANVRFIGVPACPCCNSILTEVNNKSVNLFVDQDPEFEVSARLNRVVPLDNSESVDRIIRAARSSQRPAALLL